MTQKALQTAVHAALRNWAEQTAKPNSFLENLQIVRLKREKLGGSSPTAYRLATNEVLMEGIDTLKLQNEDSANLIIARFIHDQKQQAIAYKMHLSLDQVKRRQRSAIVSLTHIIWEQETAVRTTQIHALKSSLMPPSYTHLFGIRKQQQYLVDQLLTDQPPWIIALVGIGGIGKTALADTVVRHIIEQFKFDQVIWLRIERAEQSESADAHWQSLILQLAAHCHIDLSASATFSDKYAQLRQFLKMVPILVVIDNLESEEETAAVTNRLQDLTNPTKFLLTSRVRLPALSTAHTIVLQELSQADSLQLLRNHARTIGLSELVHANDDTLIPVFKAIGGNPLALKLAVGLATVLSLPQILANLIQVNHQAIADLYRHIYWQSWSLLSENGRILLEMMPLAAEIGMSEEQMAEVSGLASNALWNALTELTNRSLLEIRGTTHERRYGIHRLTETFLQTEIIHWPEAPIS